MRRFALAILGTAGLLLAACSSSPSAPPVQPPAGSGAVTASGSLSSSGAKLRPAASVFYRDFAPEDLGNGKQALLFFWQPGDVFSQRSDRILTRLYGSGAATISTYKLDAGTASGMKLQFTVLLPDTFVLVNGSGAKVSMFLHPNPDELTKLVVR